MKSAARQTAVEPVRCFLGSECAQLYSLAELIRLEQVNQLFIITILTRTKRTEAVEGSYYNQTTEEEYTHTS